MIKFDEEFIDSCVNDRSGPVALTLKQKLLPVEGADSVIFPPTYADIGYNIDKLSDGTKVATIDSVGSQANRMEPLFIATSGSNPENPYSTLVPQIDIKYGENKKISIMEAGHRLGDALIRSSELADEAHSAFQIFLDTGDVTDIAKLSPTSLVFGVWDSRDTNAKLPRILQSVIRAWNIDELKRSAQYKPPVNYAKLELFSDADREKHEGNQKNPYAQRGFVDVPATKQHGGIFVYGEIRRDVIINLIALRRLNAKNHKNTRQYILGLAAVAATAPLDGFLRQGCLITPDPNTPSQWQSIGRDGTRHDMDLNEKNAFEFASKSAKFFEVGSSRELEFEKNRALRDLGASENEPTSEEKAKK